MAAELAAARLGPRPGRLLLAPALFLLLETAPLTLVLPRKRLLLALPFERLDVSPSRAAVFVSQLVSM